MVKGVKNMAGHSKWANIKHKKSKEDKRRGKLFSKLSKKISVAAKEGGGDPEMNADLRMAIQKAKDNNMPNDNIDRAIKRGTGDLEGVHYEKFVYEGYGPAGVALYLHIMSDNRNRTASEIRHILSSHGGNLGEAGCVSWMFERKGQLIINIDGKELDEDEIMMMVLEAGAEDLVSEDNIYTIYTSPDQFEVVRNNLEVEGLEFNAADIAMIPDNEVNIDDKGTAKKILNLMDDLEDHEDVQEVYANFDINDEIMDTLVDED